MKVIFLDFDGVMDTEYYDQYLHDNGLPVSDCHGIVFDPYCVDNLKAIIDQTGADIVVTSTWKYFMTYQDFLNMWEDRSLPGFITDVTPTLGPSCLRGDEIEAWLNECQAECQYVIIDDLDGSNFHDDQIARLLVVNPYNGLDEDTVSRAVALLNTTRLL